MCLALTAFGESVNGLSEVFTLQDKIRLEDLRLTEEYCGIYRLDIRPTDSVGESSIAGLPYVDVFVEDSGLIDPEGRRVAICAPANRRSFGDSEVTLIVVIQPEGSKQPDELRVYYACA